jgi:hypothetical protein
MSGDDRALPVDFLATLAGDAKEAEQRYRNHDTPVHRREFIKSLFATAEGFVWALKRDVFAHTEARLTHLEQAALLEESHRVDDQGNVSSDDRFLSLLKSLRLTVRLVQRYRPALQVDFGTHEWSALKSSVHVRNRLVHPKLLEDLTVTDEEIKHAMLGFSWLMHAQASITAALHDPDYKAIDLIGSMYAGFAKASPELQKSHDKMQIQLQLMQLETAASRKHREIMDALIAERFKINGILLQELAAMLPEMVHSAAKFHEGINSIQQTLRGDQTDRPAILLELLLTLYPDARDSAHSERLSKLIHSYLSEWEDQTKRIDAADAEWFEQRKDFDARRLAIGDATS